MAATGVKFFNTDVLFLASRGKMADNFYDMMQMFFIVGVAGSAD